MTPTDTTETPTDTRHAAQPRGGATLGRLFRLCLGGCILASCTLGPGPRPTRPALSASPTPSAPQLGRAHHRMPPRPERCVEKPVVVEAPAAIEAPVLVEAPVAVEALSCG